MKSALRSLFHHRLERRAERLAARIAAHLPEGARLLDIGSGTGHNARALARRVGGTCLEADVVDFHVVGDGPTLFDGIRLPLADGAVDIALLIHVLGYVEDPAGLLREASRASSAGVAVVQSTYRGSRGRAFLRARGWLQGRAAFRLCRTLGLIPNVSDRLSPRRMFTREEVETVAHEAGLATRLVAFEAAWRGMIGRDLWIFERRPR